MDLSKKVPSYSSSANHDVDALQFWQKTIARVTRGILLPIDVWIRAFPPQNGHGNNFGIAISSIPLTAFLHFRPPAFHFCWADVIVQPALACPLRSASFAVKGKSGSSQGRPALGLQSVGDDPLIAHVKPDSASSTVELGAGIICPIGAAAQNLKRSAIVTVSGNRASRNGNAAKPITVIATDGKLAANRRNIVPVMLLDIFSCLLDVAGADFKH